MKKIKITFSILGLIALILILSYFSRYLCLPIQIEKQIDSVLLGPSLDANKDTAVLNIALAILKNTTLILQAIGIAIAILGFLGFKEILDIRKVNREMGTTIKDIMAEHERYRKTSAEFEKRIKKRIDHEYNLIRARIFLTQNFYEEAWEILSKMPNDLSYEICLNKGMVLAQRGDYSDAITSFESALRFPDADKTRVYLNLGKCWYDNKDYERAIVEFDKAIGIKSNYWAAYNNKALSLKRLGRVGDAIVELKKITSIDKKNDKAYYNLACYYALTSNQSDAIKNLKIAIALKSSNAKIAKSDADFASIENSLEFKELVAVD